MIYDSFLTTYPELKAHSLTCEFVDEINPVDGVTYPAICKDIPMEVESELINNLSIIKGSPIENYTLFMRMTMKDTPCPHIAHTDAVMGAKSCMVYLHEHPMSGTSFLLHKASGITYHPQAEEFQEIVQRDSNNRDAWERTGSVLSKENRAAVFDSHLIHCAEPIGGFGNCQKTARIVLTCFYD